MNNWFECRVRYEKLDAATGKTKKVTEPYLVDAITFAEAEERLYRNLEVLISGEFTVKAVAKAQVADIFEYPVGEFWWKCRVAYEDIDKESGRQKSTTATMYVTADHAKEAYERIHESLKSMVVPFEIRSVVQSPLVDIFPYNPNEHAHEQQR